ncbi:PDR/VanB family oxidoreductase [Zavarzinia aquatilis]|uniref:Oxidoreductase n=1 Tax=Zavarzinia aquatilis TaxID=2211142 RepID=A0A317EJ82_9PROT|nr:PDR/VanB family oxidoreductase [Zavarzinia aquatilis]PWR25305.1 oxidoreductase [Zavarzinia aquatilis]
MRALELKLVVVGRRTVAEGIVGFSLAHADGTCLPAYGPGSHIEVRVEGVGLRHYSLTGDDPARYDIAVAIDQNGRGGSRAIDRLWQMGREIEVSAPRNNFPLGKAREALLIVGGIGITPILSIRRALADAGCLTRTHYAARSRRHLAFADELSTDAMGTVAFHVDSESRLDIPAIIAAAPQGADIYVCGPTGMLEAVETALEARWDLTLFTERFSAAPPRSGEAFEVTLASDGRRFRVDESSTILGVLRAHGCNPDTSCEGGVCGTCRTAVIAGEILHQDYFLSDMEKAEGRSIVICVSRAKPGSNLILDL